MNKYLNFDIFYQFYPDEPKISLNWYRLKANLKFYYKDHNSFHFIMKIFNIKLFIELKWNHVSRPKNSREIELQEKLDKLFKR